MELADESMDRKYPETTDLGQKLFNCQRTDGETATKWFVSTMDYRLGDKAVTISQTAGTDAFFPNTQWPSDFLKCQKAAFTVRGDNVHHQLEMFSTDGEEPSIRAQIFPREIFPAIDRITQLKPALDFSPDRKLWWTILD